MSALLKAPRVEVPRLPHSALPWKIGQDATDLVDPDCRGKSSCFMAIDAPGHGAMAIVVTKMEEEEHDPASAALVAGNAAYIVQACNAFPQLLHALEMIRDADDDCRRDSRPCMPLVARATVDAALASAVPA